jgi:hypothetical protein
MASGTGTPEPGGMLTREVLRAVRQIVAAVDLAGMDIDEVSPPYDQAETTSMAANRAALESISVNDVKRAALGLGILPPNIAPPPPVQIAAENDASETRSEADQTAESSPEVTQSSDS